MARKILDRGLRPGAVAQYRTMQQSKARVLLTRLLENPREWEAHFELSVYVSPLHSPIIVNFLVCKAN
jgi:hypothetical protein